MHVDASEFLRAADADVAAGILADHGVCYTPSLLDANAIDELRSLSMERFGELLRAVAIKAVAATVSGEPPEQVGFAEIVERDGGRFDCRHYELHAAAPLAQAVHFLSQLARRALGDDEAVLIGCGQVVAMSVEGWEGADDAFAEDGASLGAQAWHMDGAHLFDGDAALALPPHALTMFVPLVDLTHENGPTEFAPGSHRLRLADGPADDAPRAAILAPAGSAIVFDYRTWHRGLPNCGARAACIRVRVGSLHLGAHIWYPRQA
jgi:hypothetical protein